MNTYQWYNWQGRDTGCDDGDGGEPQPVSLAPETLCHPLLFASLEASSPVTQLERDHEESWMAVWCQLDLPANVWDHRERLALI